MTGIENGSTMKKKWIYTIWFNLVFDLVVIGLACITYPHFILFSVFCLILALHTIYLFIIAIISFVGADLLKGIVFLVQSGLIGYCIVFAARWWVVMAMAGLQFGGVYTDEGSVNSARTECEYAKQVSDSAFYQLMEGTNDSSDILITREARLKYYEEGLQKMGAFEIVSRGCRTYEDSVIVFRLKYKSGSIYDAEIKRQGKRNFFMIVNFRYSQFLR